MSKKLIKDIDNYLKKKQKGGKILGKGRDGVVVDPPKLCNKTMNPTNKVSKLINISDVTFDELNEYINEYKVGQQFRKIDPIFQHFLPGIDMCKFSSTDLDLSKELKNDIKNSEYKGIGNKIDLLNIVMKKGQDFKSINSLLKSKDLLKSMYYLLLGAKKSIYDLNTCLLDIKYPNLLYSSDDNNKKIYPVFIDFSNDFVINSSNKFDIFLNTFGGVTNYPIWPIELNILYLTQKYSSKVENNIKKKIKNHQIDEILIYIKKLLDEKNGLLKLYEKIMIFQIGLSYKETINLNETNIKITELLNNMTNVDITKRMDINDIIKYIDNIHKFKNNRNKLLINLKVKNNIKQKIVGLFQKKKKKSIQEKGNISVEKSTMSSSENSNYISSKKNLILKN